MDGNPFLYRGYIDCLQPVPDWECKASIANVSYWLSARGTGFSTKAVATKENKL